MTQLATVDEIKAIESIVDGLAKTGFLPYVKRPMKRIAGTMAYRPVRPGELPDKVVETLWKRDRDAAIEEVCNLPAAERRAWIGRWTAWPKALHSAVVRVSEQYSEKLSATYEDLWQQGWLIIQDRAHDAYRELEKGYPFLQRWLWQHLVKVVQYEHRDVSLDALSEAEPEDNE